MRYSDFIVYVDESGDHSLCTVDPRYPVFGLALCIFRKTTYSEQIAPALRRLKFSTFGHDMVVLHESEVRKRVGAFAALGRERSDQFLNALTELIAQADFKVLAILIDKRQQPAIGAQPPNAYHLALSAALEGLFRLLLRAGQRHRIVHVVCEARGLREDAELTVVFQQLCEDAGYARDGIRFEIVIAHKRTNSEGLQLADLTARPLGLSVLRPEQPNRAADIVRRKLVNPGAMLISAAHAAPQKAEGLQSHL